jgi:hypothetical protein
LYTYNSRKGKTKAHQTAPEDLRNASLMVPPIKDFPDNTVKFITVYDATIPAFKIHPQQNNVKEEIPHNNQLYSLIYCTGL